MVKADVNPGKGASLSAQELKEKPLPVYIIQLIEFLVWQYTCPRSAGFGAYTHVADKDRPLARALRGYLVEMLEEGAGDLDPAAFVDGWHQALRDVEVQGGMIPEEMKEP